MEQVRPGAARLPHQPPIGVGLRTQIGSDQAVFRDPAPPVARSAAAPVRSCSSRAQHSTRVNPVADRALLPLALRRTSMPTQLGEQPPLSFPHARHSSAAPAALCLLAGNISGFLFVMGKKGQPFGC
ncbi:hypothetical protein ZWY2020_039574 [Hordeum vulgare]|nr:hypothetical protein ZWY2020_039574 [Hordeum vulgare]